MGIAPRREAVRAARHAVTELMSRWGVSSEGMFQVELIVSELLTNALQHGCPVPGSEIGLLLGRDGGGVLVEVEDGGGTSSLFASSSASTASDDGAEHGRGLLLVEELGQGWGWRRLGNGHHSVWAYIETAESRGAR